MNLNVKLTEQLALLATLDPVSQSAATVVTSWVSIREFESILALIQTGVLGTAATVDAKLRQAKDSSGGTPKDITGKSITQLVKASNDNNQVLLECRAEDLDGENGYSYVALSLTVGTAASIVSAALFGGNPRHASASGSNQAAVVQVVA